MPTHPDAIGYLDDLSKELNEPWFKMVCDLAARSNISVLDKLTLDTLFALFTERASYAGIKSTTGALAAAVPAIPADFLEKLSGFVNFKFLGDTIELNFKKRITLIFGPNGSGKSSLCESLKALATPDQPSRPLENVRTAGAVSPTFGYKFKSDAAQQTWTPAMGFGPRRTTVKYFDTSIAIRNVSNAVEPGRVIILAPFKLHVFEWAKGMTTKFRATLQQAQQDNLANLTQALAVIKEDFLKFKGRPLAIIEAQTAAVLPAQINLGKEFTGQNLLTEKRADITELEKAASEEGLKLLRAEHRELESFLTSLNSILKSAAGLWALEPAQKMKTLAEKQAAQEVLAKALIPKDGTLDIRGNHNDVSLVLWHGPIQPPALARLSSGGRTHGWRLAAGYPRCNGGTLLTGDLTCTDRVVQNMEKHFSGRLRESAILQVPHHGSLHSWNVKLLGVTSPAVMSIISSGISNGYRHPHPQVIDSLSNTNGGIRWFLSNERNAVAMHIQTI